MSERTPSGRITTSRRIQKINGESETELGVLFGVGLVLALIGVVIIASIGDRDPINEPPPRRPAAAYAASPPRASSRPAEPAYDTTPSSSRSSGYVAGTCGYPTKRDGHPCRNRTRGGRCHLHGG